ncbi:hypothetical protein SCANM63S_02428 [Streptomyces canarius]
MYCIMLPEVLHDGSRSVDGDSTAVRPRRGAASARRLLRTRPRGGRRPAAERGSGRRQERPAGRDGGRSGGRRGPRHPCHRCAVRSRRQLRRPQPAPAAPHRGLRPPRRGGAQRPHGGAGPVVGQGARPHGHRRGLPRRAAARGRAAAAAARRRRPALDRPADHDRSRTPRAPSRGEPDRPAHGLPDRRGQLLRPQWPARTARGTGRRRGRRRAAAHRLPGDGPARAAPPSHRGQGQSPRTAGTRRGARSHPAVGPRSAPRGNAAHRGHRSALRLAHQTAARAHPGRPAAGGAGGQRGSGAAAAHHDRGRRDHRAPPGGGREAGRDRRGGGPRPLPAPAGALRRGRVLDERGTSAGAPQAGGLLPT